MYRNVHLKSDGTPDLRYKENGGGQSNRIYPDNNMYGGAYGNMPYNMPYNMYGGAYGTNMQMTTPYSRNYQPGYGNQYGGNYASPIREDGMPDGRFAVNRPYY